MRVLLLLALFAIAFAANDCSSRADGLYALSDCSSSFLTCSGGVPRIMDCPANLIFSEQLQLCDYPGSIAACAGSTESPSSTAAPGEPTCSGRADGFYELSGCNTNFLTCSGGVARVMECPAQLIFVEERQLCDYAESVPACEASSGEESGESSGGESGDVSGESGENSTTPASTEASAENPEESGDASGESGLSPSDDAASGMSGDESGLWSGILPVEYDPSGASGEASGETREYSGETSGVSGEGISGEESGDEASPNSGEASGSSDAETSGAEGSGIENSGIESSGMETSGTETSGGESSGIEGSGVESSGEGLSCSGTSDGFYSLGCSSKLKACSNSEATTLECPSNLVFNEAVGACDYPGYVSACSLNRDASGNEVESSGEASGGISFCEGRANGFYQLGCSSSILSCANELEHMLVCPLGLMYDQSRAVCDYPLSIVACREEGSGDVSGSVWEEEDEEREATRLPVSPRPVVPID